MSEPRCLTCRFWDGTVTAVPAIDIKAGPCRRYPIPQPTVAPTHWCGEHQARPPLPEEMFGARE